MVYIAMIVVEMMMVMAASDRVNNDNHSHQCVDNCSRGQGWPLMSRGTQDSW